MRRGPQVGQVFTWRDEVVQIGRGMRNDFIIDDNEVSREHCRVRRSGQAYALFDLSSNNGTFVNGHRITDSWQLKHGDIIELGDSITLQFQIVSGQTADLAEPGRLYYLVAVVTGRREPNVYPLQSASIHIGRGNTNDIIILEPEMSRQHLRLDREGEGYNIRDSGSTNGAQINGSDLTTPLTLRPGDVIKIGQNIALYYTLNPDDHLGPSQHNTRSLDTRTLSSNSITTSVKREPGGSTGEFVIPRPGEEVTASQVGHGLRPGSLSDHLFMVYAREDWEKLAAMTFNRLLDQNISVWVDQYLPVGSDDWRLAVDQARLESWGLIVILTQRSMQAPTVHQIIRHFSNREKPIFFLAETIDLPIPIAGGKTHRVTYSQLVPEVSIQQLVQVIRRYR
jgi:pSer/pThr/pTyr-binding forkhead associated (FHA) protein